MHGTGPSFYGNKRSLKEKLGVEKRRDEREKMRRKRRRMYWNVFGDGWSWKEVAYVKHCESGPPPGSLCYLFINRMHGTTVLIAVVHSCFHIQTTYQSVCRVDLVLTCSCLCSEPYALYYKSSLYSTKLKFLLCIPIKKLMHNKHTTKPSQTPLFKLSFTTPPGCM